MSVKCYRASSHRRQLQRIAWIHNQQCLIVLNQMRIFIYPVLHMLLVSWAGNVSCRLIKYSIQPKQYRCVSFLARTSPKLCVHISFVLLFVCYWDHDVSHQSRRNHHQRGTKAVDGVGCVWRSSVLPQSNLASGKYKSRLCICSTLQPWQIYTAQACVSKAPEVKKRVNFPNSLSHLTALFQMHDEKNEWECGVFTISGSSLWACVIL